MKEKGTYVEVTTKIGAQTLDDLFEELKKQLNVEEVVFSSRKYLSRSFWRRVRGDSPFQRRRR